MSSLSKFKTNYFELLFNVLIFSSRFPFRDIFKSNFVKLRCFHAILLWFGHLDFRFFVVKLRFLPNYCPIFVLNREYYFVKIHCRYSFNLLIFQLDYYYRGALKYFWGSPELIVMIQTSHFRFHIYLFSGSLECGYQFWGLFRPLLSCHPKSCYTFRNPHPKQFLGHYGAS